MFRSFSRIARVSSLAGPLILTGFVSKCDESSSNTNVDSEKSKEPILVTESDFPSDWEVEKAKCSFCRYFIESPCKEPFKYWSACVDKAKELDREFIFACHEYTSKLLECTSSNSEYFSKLDESSEEQQADDEENQSSEQATESS